MTETVQTEIRPVEKKKGSKLWLISLLLLVVLNFVVVKFYKPVEPEINIATDSLLFHMEDGVAVRDPWFTIPFIGDVYLTNTMPAIALILVILLSLSAAVHQQTKDGQLKSHGVVLLLEIIFSALTGMTDSAVEEKWRDRIYPFFLTVFLYVLIANLTKLLPFFETFGLVYPTSENGFIAQKWGSWFYAIQSTAAAAGQQGYRLVSLFRGASTDLNFTVAIAIVTVILVQVIGVKAHGFSYFHKFIDIKGMITNPKKGLINGFVGILELISEIAKIASFGFRLFGNMFAGMVLLLFLGYMVPWLVNTVILLYEAFVGILQAFIFGMLATVFMSMAVRSES